MHPWTLGAGGEELVPFTTFSVAMIHRQSAGQLPLFVEGIEAFKRLQVRCVCVLAHGIDPYKGQLLLFVEGIEAKRLQMRCVCV